MRFKSRRRCVEAEGGRLLRIGRKGEGMVA